MNPDKQDENYLPIKKKGIDIVPDENQHSSDFFVSSEKLNERKETLFDNKKDIANIQQELRRQKTITVFYIMELILQRVKKK